MHRLVRGYYDYYVWFDHRLIRGYGWNNGMEALSSFSQTEVRESQTTYYEDYVSENITGTLYRMNIRFSHAMRLKT